MPRVNSYRSRYVSACDRVGITNEAVENRRESAGGSSRVTATGERVPEGSDLADLETPSGVERAERR